MPVMVVITVVMPVADAHARFRRDGGRWRVLAQGFDMGIKRTRWRGGVSSVATPHRQDFFACERNS
jgi:hypothetical protein